MPATAVPQTATLYLLPEGLTSAASMQDQGRPLAGGPLAFTSVRLIFADAGRRIEERLVPVAGLDPEIAALSPVHRERAEALLSRLTAKRGPLALPGRDLPLGFGKPRVMGILNVTPDSFSDGGRFVDTAAAIQHGKALLAAGADIVDVGGESTRPGARPVFEGDEINRIKPVIEALAGSGVISIDTRKAEVMRAALGAGAHILNDVSALSYDDNSLAVAAGSTAPVVLMHAQGDPQTMQENPHYDDVLLDVFDYLEDRIAAAEAAGVDRARIIVDPGIGFGKTVTHNLKLLNGLALFHGLGCPVLLGVSRKRFIGALDKEAPVEKRLGGSVAAAMWGLKAGVQILRVHDVAETVQAVAVFQGLQDASFIRD